MKKILLFLLLLLSPIALSQEKKRLTTPIFFKEIDADIFLGYDAFGFYYAIKDNVFSKTKDEKTWSYKNISLGKITKVDLENPLNIVLFYENFNTIVTLDNQLNETQKINFSENPVPIVVLATGMASQNRFWIYNNLTQQIGLFDYLKNNYMVLTQSLKGNLKFYSSDFNYFQWIDEHRNWYSCDIFGKITALGTVADFNQFQILNQQSLLFLKEEQLYLQDFKNNFVCPIENVEKSIKSFSYKDEILSIFTTRGITNYKIILP